MSQFGAVVRRPAGKTMPEAYLQLLIDNNNCMGAVVSDGPDLVLNKEDGLDLEYLKSTEDTYKDNDVTYYFGKSTAALDLNDISPHIILGTSDEPEMVAFVAGQFPGYAKAESSHPETFFYVHDFLQPEIESMSELCEDVEKILNNLEKPIQKKKMLKDASSYGVVCLVGAGGWSITWAQADNAMEFEWGWTSETYGYPNAQKAEETKEVASTRKTFPKRSQRSTVREAAPGTGPSTSETTPKTPAETAKADTKQTTQNAKPYDVRKESPPLTHSRKDRKAWYRCRIGYYPKGGEQNVAISVFFDTKTKRTLTVSQVKSLGLAKLGLPKLENPDRDTGKDTETEHVEQTEEQRQAATSKQVSTDLMPIISPNSREFFQNLLKTQKAQKAIAETGEAVTNPQFLKEIEEKVAPYYTQLGYKDADTFWASVPKTYEFLFDVARQKPDIAAKFMHDLMCINLSGRLRKEAKLSEQEKQELAAEELKPETPKGKVFPKRNKAA